MNQEPERASRACRGSSSAGRLAFLMVLAWGALLGCADVASGEGNSGAGSGAGAETHSATAPAPSGDGPVDSKEADKPAASSTSESSADGAGADDSQAAVSSPRAEAAEEEEVIDPTPPHRVQIPSIDLDESIAVDLHIQADGRLEDPVDWDDVGWFAGGSMPGQPGPTVIAGHVDSRSGPAVFYQLIEMEPGDEVTVTDEDGQEHIYQVDRTADFPKDDFPTRVVFGAQLTDELRLITCTGEFDAAAGRHLDNRVVFASRIS